ncbi:hypothetical protein EON63_07020 [archaeon]|nr:MAG: hypothetical protein EON63_07020 [archaeon]
MSIYTNTLYTHIYTLLSSQRPFILLTQPVHPSPHPPRARVPLGMTSGFGGDLVTNGYGSGAEEDEDMRVLKDGIIS